MSGGNELKESVGNKNSGKEKSGIAIERTFLLGTMVTDGIHFMNKRIKLKTDMLVRTLVFSFLLLFIFFLKRRRTYNY